MIELIYYEERCTGCGNCAVACPLNVPSGVLRIVGGRLKPDIRCEGCGVCISACPFNALELKLPGFKSFEKYVSLSASGNEVEVNTGGSPGKAEKTKKVTRVGSSYPDYFSEWFSTGLLRRVFEADGFNVDIPELIKRFEKAGSIFPLLKDLVIDKKLCSLCGACIASCPEDALEMDGYPHLVDECKNCASCLLKCPKTDFFTLESEGDIGPYRQILSAKSTRIDAVAAGSGAATSLLIYAMEAELIDCAIVVGKKPFIATKPHELTKAAGIKFAVAPTLALLKDAVKRGFRKIAVVGVPCHVTAARKMQKLGCDEIKLIFGVFCPRGNHPEKDAVACRECEDLTAEHADVSFGNTGSPKGWRTIIVRTEIGEKIVSGAISKGYIQMGRCDVEKVVSMAKRKRGKA
ncbi:Coenzyme F420 hydrogenase/dehydrogenase, beta subunit C-terminal domain [Archaeoglobus veneficus]|uniref:Coenzyme F420 hydrogenase/dehydrogenase beta subunit domain protein n=1 Tax=Archaeoglobus veneficus (strain DSM 11195 / SNP6) TaxID=693661 RepID=F2KT97_ARCVS|nr:Coenzyme F420 hydrogenase/dehydrogenase, beta subunit C-terminal domain [Archaeoglobus veneficus]AEA47127.1 coenzyme F420 hydrogenase/dehydrogenase beta subunit domain protein [Archaeoglobus veneficus SNP6]